MSASQGTPDRAESLGRAFTQRLPEATALSLRASGPERAPHWYIEGSGYLREEKEFFLS